MKTMLVTAATLLTFAATNAQAATTNLLAFGDSLMDSGNIAAATSASGGDFPFSVYPNGQFTNGDAWTTQLGLAPSLLGGSNYAYGGARAVSNTDAVPDLLDQVLGFASSVVEVPSGTQATIWAGGNDFLALPDAPTLKDISHTITLVIRKIGFSVQELAKVGVSEVLVLGLPDFGLLPSNAGDPEAAAQASFLTGQYNSLLEQALAGLDGLLPGTEVGFFDVDSFFQQIVGQVPSELVSVPCLADPAGCAANPENYVLYDDIHPSEWVHSLLAEAVAAELDIDLAPVPLPATAPLLLAGLGGLGLWARRRKSRA